MASPARPTRTIGIPPFRIPRARLPARERLVQTRSSCMRGNRMVVRRGALVLGAVLLSQCFAIEAARAQINVGNQWPNPRLTVLTPCGGKAGTTVQVGWTGTELEKPEQMIFSHPGIKAVPTPPPPPDPKAKPDPKKP